jgi:heme exporter protein D
MADFFYMDGYWFYVWASYLVTAVVLIANVVQPLLCQRKVRKALARRERRERMRQ